MGSILGWVWSLLVTMTAFLVGQCFFASQNNVQAAEPSQLNVNDISFLWPAPKNAADVEKLISADEKLSHGQEIWPPEVFQKVLAIAVSPQAAITIPPSNSKFSITFPDPEFQKLKNWKIAGIRIDPSAPGCDQRLREALGSTPQIRLVLQPVTVSNKIATAHDFTAHVVFDFVKRDAGRDANGSSIPAIPDIEAFDAIVKDLLALKAELKTAGIDTDGPLRVHPGFAAAGFDLPKVLRTFLAKHLRPERLKHLAFMGIRRPEPWIFVGMQKNSAGEFEMRGQANMLLGLKPQRVIPDPKTSNLGPGNPGVSTAPLFGINGDQLDKDAVTGVTGLPIPKLRDIPDIIANPKFTNVLNTDCISCHTETTQRVERKLGLAQAPFAFITPSGFKGLDPSVTPKDSWNVRNFGWGRPKSGIVHSTASQRTANEAAESAEFINKNILVNPAVTKERVSNALTLVMKAKNPAEAVKLKALVTGMQALPDEQNPIAQALERTKRVHNARFVFLDDQTLAIITTYDDDFDTYIDLFIDELGDVFDKLLEHIEGAPTKSVKIDREGFQKFVHDHDIPVIGKAYSAYPHLRVQDIRELDAHSESSHKP